MRRSLLFGFVFILILGNVAALNLQFVKISEKEILVEGIDQPAVFTYEVSNVGDETRVEFYNLLGFSLTPVGKVTFAPGEAKQIDVAIAPIGDFDYLGLYTVPYFIQDDNNAQLERSVTFRRIQLKDAVIIGANSFDPDSNSIEVYIKNSMNFDFTNVQAQFSSVFFNFEETFDLGAKEQRNFSVALNKEEFDELMAGFYSLNVALEVEDAGADLTTNLEFKEKKDVKTQMSDDGFFIRTNAIKKINEGNVEEVAQVGVERNVISRLFTTVSPTPDIVEREGFGITYLWERNLAPGEDFEVVVRTNWLFPLVLIAFIILVVVLVKRYTTTALGLSKKISFVRAKGGEFALKVTVVVRARKFVEKINVVDRLPPLVKVYEKFGANAPSKVEPKKRRLEWNFEQLDAGEIRVLTYIIYSKQIGIMGKFSLPSAQAMYERDGKLREAASNRAFFVSEPVGKDIEEE